MQSIDYIDKALIVVVSRIANFPCYEIYKSIFNQLEYIKAILEGRDTDKSKLHKLTIGIYAVKEFEEADPELSRCLKDAGWIADQLGRGVKIKLP